MQRPAGKVAQKGIGVTWTTNSGHMKQGERHGAGLRSWKGFYYYKQHADQVVDVFLPHVTMTDEE